MKRWRSACNSPGCACVGSPRGACLRGALWGFSRPPPVVHTALAEVVCQIGHPAGLLALRRGDGGWGTLCGGAGAGDAREAESGEGRRGDDGGKDSSNAHLVPLSRIIPVGALISLIAM